MRGIGSRKVIDAHEVQSIEVEKIDSKEVKKRLELGKSISVADNRKQKLNLNHIAKKKEREVWYFTCV